MIDQLQNSLTFLILHIGPEKRLHRILHRIEIGCAAATPSESPIDFVYAIDAQHLEIILTLPLDLDLFLGHLGHLFNGALSVDHRWNDEFAKN